MNEKSWKFFTFYQHIQNYFFKLKENPPVSGFQAKAENKASIFLTRCAAESSQVMQTTSAIVLSLKFKFHGDVANPMKFSHPENSF